MTAPPERDAGSPEATRAEDEPRSRSELLVIILVVLLAIGTIALTQAVRQRRMSRPPTVPAMDTPAALGLPPIEVAVEIQSVASRILAAWRRDGAPPASLERLPRDEDDPPPDPDSPARRDPPLDPWGRPYALERALTDGRTVLTLTSYGSDGEPGGEGSGQDLVMEIAAPSE